MVSVLRIQLIEDIKLIIEKFRHAYIDIKFGMYKDGVLEQKQYFLNNYSRLFELSPSLKTLFDSCFEYLNSSLVFHAKRLRSAIITIEEQMLELVQVQEDIHISNITNTIGQIIDHSDRYINDMEQHHDLCVEFNEKMKQLMTFPVHFWKLLNDNFDNEPVIGGLAIQDLSKYKLTIRNTGETEISSYCFECFSNWIMENSQGHTIVICVNLIEFKYNCKNYIVTEEIQNTI